MKNSFLKKLTMVLAVAVLCGLALGINEVQAAIYGPTSELAGEIKLNTEYTGSLADEEYKAHWFTFTTKNSDDYYYNFVLDPNKTKGSNHFDIYELDGTKVQGCGNGQTQFRLDPNTTYNMKCSSYTGIDDTDKYAFSINTLKDPETDYIGDCTIELKNGKKQKGSIATLGDEDWFWFKANSNEATLTVLTKDNWNIKYAAYDEDGAKIASDSTTAFKGTLNFDTVKGKKYYINIYTNDNGFSNFEFGKEKDDTYQIMISNGKAEMLDNPACLFSGTKVVAGKALPGATVKCSYGGKSYKAKADDFGLYIIKLNSALKKNATVSLTQTIGGSTSKKLSVKVSE